MGNVISQKVLSLSQRTYRAQSIDTVMKQLRKKTTHCPQPSFFDFQLFKSMLCLPCNGWFIEGGQNKFEVNGYQKSLPITLGANIVYEPTWLTAKLGQYNWLIEFVAPDLEMLVNIVQEHRKGGTKAMDSVFLWHWKGCIDDKKSWKDVYTEKGELKMLLQCLVIQRTIVFIMCDALKHKVNPCDHSADYLLSLLSHRDRLEYIM